MFGAFSVQQWSQEQKKGLASDLQINIGSGHDLTRA